MNNRWRAALRAFRHVAARRHGRTTFAIERSENGRFRRARRPGVADQIHQHRHAHRVRQQNEFLPLVGAHVAGVGQELNCLPPLCFVQPHVLDELVNVFRQADHDLAQPGIGRPLESTHNFGGDVVLSGEPGFCSRQRSHNYLL